MNVKPGSLARQTAPVKESRESLASLTASINPNLTSVSPVIWHHLYLFIAKISTVAIPRFISKRRALSAAPHIVGSIYLDLIVHTAVPSTTWRYRKIHPLTHLLRCPVFRLTCLFPR
ncbi:hypothetical protein PAXRUDRAFT_552012 [Paxillus rubicundulus Ve08.2h10]|uniref:Uncharacterized protein n=1 Tax=Paxillus rubicundulus Ve08.2h10 TaxID=930991 RepID=A0A0D0D2U1_9AGAM|nr:hypothetical protein PAXRUDRAFT_552012 [Paxillus rubicundulus Ve08.2h10]